MEHNNTVLRTKGFSFAIHEVLAAVFLASHTMFDSVAFVVSAALNAAWLVSWVVYVPLRAPTSWRYLAPLVGVLYLTVWVANALFATAGLTHQIQQVQFAWVAVLVSVLTATRGGKAGILAAFIGTSVLVFI